MGVWFFFNVKQVFVNNVFVISRWKWWAAWRCWRKSTPVWLQSTAVPTVRELNLFWSLIEIILAVPTPIHGFSSYRCPSSPGQSDQAAVLRRGADPDNAHVGGKGERRLPGCCMWTALTYKKGYLLIETKKCPLKHCTFNMIHLIWW